MKFKSALSIISLIVFSSAAAPYALATTVSLGITPNPATYGKPVTLTATVSPAPASGTVAFYDGVNIIGVGPLSSGVATFTTKQLLAGARQITARFAPAGAVSPIVTETVTALAASGFNQVATYPVGPPVVPGQINAAEQSPVSVAVGDFNSDGNLDAVLPIFVNATGSDSQVALMLGTGTGAFQAPIYINAGTNIVAVAVGDFNGDGKLDLAVADAGSPDAVPAVAPSVNILLGNGSGTFLAPAAFTLSVSGFTPYYLVIGDFNRDGNEDVAVSNATGAEDVSVLLGNGNGTLGVAANYSTGTQTGAFGLAVGDFNGDGIPDIAVAEDVAVILLGTGSGTFTVGSSNTVGSFPNDIQMGDFNKDGKADLVVASPTDNQISILLGNGNGTFLPQVAYSVGNPSLPGPTPDSITVADFNGDGNPDLAVANSYLFSGDSPPIGSVSILLGNGNGTFQTEVSYATGPSPVTVAQGDFTGMGTVDLVTADFGDGEGTYPGDLGVLTSAGCVSSITTDVSPNFDENGTSFLIDVTTTSPSCSWTASTNAPSWIFLTPTSGIGTGVASATIVQNTTGLDRSGTITIGGQILAVTQDFTVEVFADVTPSAPYFDAVNLLSAKGITTGCADDMYCPLEDITRAEMAIFIVRSVYGSGSAPFTYSPTPHFQDVPAGAYGFAWIQKMYELGITTGCAPNLFCPDQQVTRDQMAVFIIRARYGANTQFTYSTTPVFTDVPQTDFAFKYVQRMAEDGITTGCTATTYCPADQVTRGNMATFVMRGAFNVVLPNPVAPVITAVSPTTLVQGGSATFTVTGANVSFIVGTTVEAPVFGFDPANGVTASPVTLITPTQFTVTLTASPTAPLQPYSIYVQTLTQEAVLPNGLVVTAPPPPQ